MKKFNVILLLLLGAIISGQAIHWFVGGAYLEYSTFRNVFVSGQLLVGIGLIVYG